ncbi:PREDICTED: uncharacterized protein LOC108552371 [Eufriesea mexicana]|uniref:uncharacterized protein LOC108552371 n=1 Tax=Eufriesea mexicana TaxID=516756 RepID=UPI00083BBA4E|nr:PREDICTED: uncharacterized protein LOC108552371 [Eufriesea mexicana]
MRYNMSEKYVKEILEKLEEIEKLHAKLRCLVPRVKSYELKDVEIKQSVMRETNRIDTNLPEQKPIDFHRRSEIIRNIQKDLTTKIKNLFDPNSSTMKYFKKFKDHSSNKWKRFNNFLTTIYEPDITFVSRASQVSNSDLLNIISKNTSTIFSPKKKQSKKRRSTLQEMSERLLKRFGYFYDPNLVNESTMSIHDHGLGKNEPRIVQRTSIIPDGKTETIKIVSSARTVSVENNKKWSSSGS